MRFVTAFLAAGAALVASALFFVLGFNENFVSSSDELFRFKRPMTWESPMVVPDRSDSMESGFIILKDNSYFGKFLNVPELHLTVASRKDWPDLKTAFKISAGNEAKNVKVKNGRLDDGTEAISWDQTDVDFGDRIDGRKLVVYAEDVSMRSYLMKAPDGRIFEASYYIPAHFLSRWRAHTIYGKIIRSLQVVENMPTAPSVSGGK
jgi:hypothetical protein